MNKYIFRCQAALVLLLVSLSLHAQQTISINTEESRVYWTGKKPTGEHKGYIKIREGKLQSVNNEIKGGSFIMDMNTITNLDIKDEGSRDKLVSHLKSPDFFDVQKFPTARFVITNVSKLNNGAPGATKKATHRVEGDLTLKSVTKRVSFDASINGLNGKFAATALPFTINRTEWGVNYQSKSIVAGLRDEFIFDDVTLTIDLVSQ